MNVLYYIGPTLELRFCPVTVAHTASQIARKLLYMRLPRRPFVSVSLVFLE